MKRIITSLILFALAAAFTNAAFADTKRRNRVGQEISQAQSNKDGKSKRVSRKAKVENQPTSTTAQDKAEGKPEEKKEIINREYLRGFFSPLACQAIKSNLRNVIARGFKAGYSKAFCVEMGRRSMDVARAVMYINLKSNNSEARLDPISIQDIYERIVAAAIEEQIDRTELIAIIALPYVDERRQESYINSVKAAKGDREKLEVIAQRNGYDLSSLRRQWWGSDNIQVAQSAIGDKTISFLFDVVDDKIRNYFIEDYTKRFDSDQNMGQEMLGILRNLDYGNLLFGDLNNRQLLALRSGNKFNVAAYINIFGLLNPKGGGSMKENLTDKRGQLADLWRQKKELEAEMPKANSMLKEGRRLATARDYTTGKGTSFEYRTDNEPARQKGKQLINEAEKKINAYEEVLRLIPELSAEIVENNKPMQIKTKKWGAHECVIIEVEPPIFIAVSCKNKRVFEMKLDELDDETRAKLK